MLRLDLVQCATDVLGDVDPCLFGRGSGFSTPASEAERVPFASISPRSNSRDQIQDMRFPTWFTEQKRE
jgi:hypothetical protein